MNRRCEERPRPARLAPRFGVLRNHQNALIDRKGDTKLNTWDKLCNFLGLVDEDTGDFPPWGETNRITLMTLSRRHLTIFCCRMGTKTHGRIRRHRGHPTKYEKESSGTSGWLFEPNAQRQRDRGTLGTRSPHLQNI
jgi:hypothetical protein